MGHTESKIKDTDIQYDITIHTANKKKAGRSDSNTFVILYGDKGVSETHKLRPESRDDFKKGHVDTHPIYEKDLGNLWKVEVWKSDKSDKPGHWFIDYIEVKLKLVPDKRTIKRSFESKREVTLTGNELKTEKNDDKTEVSLSKFATSNRNVKVEGKFKLKSSQEETRRVKWIFPCYRWIDEHEELFEGTTVLPQYESQRERTNQRKDETEKKRGIYQWRLDDRLPQYMRCTFETLPFDERWNEEKLHDFMSSRMKAGANFSLDKVFGLFHSWKDFDDYADLFNILPVPKLQKSWRQDETWARLRLQGVNPCNVQRVTKWPLEKFAVSDEQVKGLLRPGTTLASEVKDNRIYLVDFSWLFKYDKPEALKEGRYVGHPQLLLYRNAEQKVLPLCIQLRTTDPYNPKECPIFTPLDTEPEWLLAKMFLANAEALQHQLQAHLLGTHLITEPMVIAMHRQMASCHPIYKLLAPHFKYQIAINVRARELLINPGGPIDDIMPLKMDTLVDIISAGFAEWTFDEATPMAMLKKNNITANPKDLPDLYYRDDAPLIWDAIFSYVKDIVDIFYRDDSDIKNDFELQAWADEVVSVGFHGNARGFPRSIESKPELVQCLATIIWTVSAQHAVLNFVQYDCYGWVPAQPGSLGIPPMGHPDSKWERGKLKMEEVFNALPYKGPCAKQIALSYILSQFSAEDQMLGQYPESYFTEDSVTIALENYRKKLAIVASVIDQRNDWDHLHPKKVPNATAV